MVPCEEVSRGPFNYKARLLYISPSSGWKVTAELRWLCCSPPRWGCPRVVKAHCPSPGDAGAGSCCACTRDHAAWMDSRTSSWHQTPQRQQLLNPWDWGKSGSGLPAPAPPAGRWKIWVIWWIWVVGTKGKSMRGLRTLWVVASSDGILKPLPFQIPFSQACGVNSGAVFISSSA